MNAYDEEHWDWISGLINQAENHQPTPTAPVSPSAPRTAEVVEVSGDNEYTVTRHTDGLVSYTPVKGMWR